VEDGAAATPGHRRSRIIVFGSLIFVLVVAAVGWLTVRHARDRLDRQVADARLCSNAASRLELVAPNMASGVPNVGFSTSRTTAGRVAADLARTSSSPHPWDEESRDTVVIRCQSANFTWLADAKGHAARAPSP
jgi:hypothetical protein